MRSLNMQIFFRKYTVSSPYPQVPHPCMWRADYGAWASPDFGIGAGPGTNPPWDTEGQLYKLPILSY